MQPLATTYTPSSSGSGNHLKQIGLRRRFGKQTLEWLCLRVLLRVGFKGSQKDTNHFWGFPIRPPWVLVKGNVPSGGVLGFPLEKNSLRKEYSQRTHTPILWMDKIHFTPVASNYQPVFIGLYPSQLVRSGFSLSTVLVCVCVWVHLRVPFPIC